MTRRRTIDPAVIDACCLIDLLVSGQGEAILRASGQYGPRVEVADDADVQTRLLAFIGRDPTG